MSTSLFALDGDTKARVSAWLANLRDAGIHGRITSTRRSNAEQQRLYEKFLRGETLLPVAVPGTSMHEFGRAVDIVFESDEDLADAADSAPDFGLRWAGLNDEVHFENDDEEFEVSPTLARKAAEAVAGTLPGPGGASVNVASGFTKRTMCRIGFTSFC